MAEADAPATCPEGHVDTTRLLSVFAAPPAAPRPRRAAGWRRLLRRGLRLRLT